MKRAHKKIDNLNDLANLLNISTTTLIHFARSADYYEFKIKKKSGGYRTIYAPEQSKKYIQKLINNILQKKYKNIDPGCVYGFNSNVPENIKANARNHLNKKFLLNIDIKNFFPTITSVMVRDIFMQKPFNYNLQIATVFAMLTTFKNSLPTGAPSSPIISNFIFTPTDLKLLELTKKYKITYSRYADDLSFSSNDEITDNIISEISAIIETSGFKLNTKKHRLLKHYNRQTVTGITVNKKLNVNRKYIRKIRAILHNIESYGLLIASTKYFNLPYPDFNLEHKLIPSLRGKIEFIGFVRGKDDKIYTDFINRLNSCYYDPKKNNYISNNDCDYIF